MACVPAAASSPKTEACPAFAARSRWPSNSAFTRASQCGNRRRMLRPRPRRRRCDARGAQPPPSRWPRASKAPSTNAPPGCVRGAHRERSSLCSAIGRARFYSETVVNAREATARAIGGGDDGVSLRSRKQGPTRSRFPLLAWPCGSMPSAPRPTARSRPTRSSSPAKTGKPTKPEPTLTSRRRSWPPNSTSSASDLSPSRRGPKGSAPFGAVVRGGLWCGEGPSLASAIVTRLGGDRHGLRERRSRE